MLYSEQEIRTAIRENKHLNEVVKLFRDTVQEMSEVNCSCLGSHDNRDWCEVCSRGRDALLKLEKLLETK